MSVHVAPEPATHDTDTEPVGHWLCCVKPALTLCGSPPRGGQMGGPDDPDPDCVVCDDLHRTTYCPLGGVCEKEP